MPSTKDARLAIEWSIRKLELEMRTEQMYQEQMERTCSPAFLKLAEGYQRSFEVVAAMETQIINLTHAVVLLRRLEKEENNDTE